MKNLIKFNIDNDTKLNIFNENLNVENIGKFVTKRLYESINYYEDEDTFSLQLPYNTYIEVNGEYTYNSEYDTLDIEIYSINFDNEIKFDNELKELINEYLIENVFSKFDIEIILDKNTTRKFIL